MSTPTLSDLLIAKTQDEWTTIALASLAGKGFPTTDWTALSPERAMLETDTACLADQSTQIPATVALVLVYYAIANAAPNADAPQSLIFVAHNWYEVDAFAPTAAIGTAILSCNSLAGPYTIAIGQLTATDAAGVHFTNITGGGLATSGTLSLSWQALNTGTSGNLSNNTLTGLLTPLPGVTLNNPGPAFTAVTEHNAGTGSIVPSGTVSPHNWRVTITTAGGRGVGVFKVSADGGATYYATGITIPGGGVYGPDGHQLVLTFAVGTYLLADYFDFTSPGSWLTSQGTPPESTVSLATRCLARWPQLAAIPTTDVYTAWALESGQGITRTKVVTDPSVAATVNIYIAGPSASVSATQVDQVQVYIDPRAPVTDIPVVIAASTTTVTITGNATYPVGQPGIPAARNDVINAYVNAVAIAGIVLVSEIIALGLNINAAGIPTGAQNMTGIQLNGGGVGVDLQLGSINVAAVVNSIVWSPV